MTKFLSLVGACILAVSSGAAEDESPATVKHSAIEFQGTLGKALRDIASKGRINLVIAEPLEQTVDISLKDLSPEEALRSIAAAYQLEIDERKLSPNKSVWMVRRARAAMVPSPPTPSPAAPPTPAAPLPPIPPVVQHDSNEDWTENLDAKTQKKLRKLLRQKRRFNFHGDRDIASTGPVHIESGQTVDNAVAYGGNLLVDGDVTGDAVAFGGNLTVNGHVGGNCTAFGGQIRLGHDAVVNGKVQALGGTIVKEEGAVVEGGEDSLGAAAIGTMISRLPRGLHLNDHGHLPERVASRKHRFWLSNFLLEFAFLFSLGFLFLIFMPNRMKQLATAIRSDPVRCGVTGLVAAFAMVPLLIMLVITVIGIPFALLLVLVSPVVVAMGLTALASEIGLRLPFLRGYKTQAIVLALGLLLILVAWQIPFFGALVAAVSIFLGIGSIIRTRLGSRGNGFPEPIPPAAVT